MPLELCVGSAAVSLQVQQRGRGKGISFQCGTLEIKGCRGLLCLLREAVLKLQVTTCLKSSGELLNGSRHSVDFIGARPGGLGGPALLPPQLRSPEGSPTGTGSPAIKNKAAALH